MKTFNSNNSFYKQSLTFNLSAVIILAVVDIFTTILYDPYIIAIYYSIGAWIFRIALIIMASKVSSLSKQYSKNKLLNWLPVLLIVTYVIEWILQKRQLIFLSNPHTEGILFMLVTLLSAIIIYLLANSLNSLKRENNQESSIINNSEAETFEKPINDKSVLESVINTITLRANSANRTIGFSLAAMVVIVIIGGSASFGTVALNESKKIRELEAERQQLLEMINTVDISDNSTVSKQRDEIKKIITNRYGTADSYQDLLKNIEKQSYVSWPDIAMRVTIAVLTIFLVQIFFHIYKYNQRQLSHLNSKAETLELYTQDGANQAELRSGLLSKIDLNPKFDKSPSPLSEQIINIIKSNEQS